MKNSINFKRFVSLLNLIKTKISKKTQPFPIAQAEHDQAGTETTAPTTVDR
jgi:hypothetical protein